MRRGWWATWALRLTQTCVALSLLWGSPRPAEAQETPAAVRHVRAVRLSADERLAIDGWLNEPVWARAEHAGDFRQQDPDTGAPASERTEVAVAFDRRHVVIGIRCFDSEPSRILANQMQRDQSLNADDRLMIAIDTYLDGRSGYYFEVNPAGAMGDGLVLPGNGIQVNRAWDGIWNARVTRDDMGWSAEIDIPLQTVTFDPRSATWGFNVQRTIRRRSEEALWSGWLRNEGLTYMAAAGRIDGLEGLTQGLGLDLMPYGIGTVGDAPARGERAAAHASAGGDIVYNVTPAVRVNASFNTDFAETEVDQRQVNLTRFPLFFPEKRAFFLEGAGLFDFSREPGNSLLPFFSRRIGLDENGTPQPIDVGAKLTGHIGDFDIGVLYARTRASDARPGEDFTVLRARRRFWAQSSVGGILTRRASDGTTRQTLGLDLAVSSSRFSRRLIEASAFALTTSASTGASRPFAYGARITYPNDPLTAWLAYRTVDDAFDPAVGFVDRRGYRLLNPDVRYTWHFNNRVVRRNSFEGTLNMFFDKENRLETRTADAQLVRLQFQSEDMVELHLRPQFERLPRPFTISRGVVLAAGSEYSFLRTRVQGTSATRRRLSGSVLYEDGGFYSGDRRQLTASLGVRPGRGWLVAVGADINRIALREGRFVTRIWTNDVNVQVNPFTSLVSRLQYDSVSRQLGWQARFRWITKPGDDLYVVYSQNWIDQDSLRPLDRKLAVKMVRTIRF